MGIVDVIILVYFLALLAGMLFFLVTSKRHWRPLLILAVLSGCALLIAYPGKYGPDKSLKPGIDLAGGTTLTYDVKIPEGRDATQVIEDTIAVLQKRVDPTGTMNLIWRRVAGNRIEVQMALAPEAITTKREAMVAAREALLVGNLDKSRVEQALGKEGPERADAFDRLAGGNPELRQKLDALAAAAAAMAEAQAPMDAAQEAYDQAQAVVDNPPADTTEEQQAENTRVADELLDELIVLSRRFNQAKSAYNAAYAQVLASNISPAELARVSDLDNDPEKAGKDQDGNPRPTPRAQAIDDLTAQNPDRAQQIQTYFTALAEYEKVKGPLDDPNDLIALLQGSGVLEMRIAAVPNQEPVDWPGYVQQLDEEGPKAGSDRPWKWYEIQDIEVFADRDLELLQQFRDAPESFTPWAARNRGLIGSVYGGRYYVLLADTEQLAMTREQEWALASVSRSSDTLGRPAVGFRMNALGAQRLGALTGPNVGRQMAVLLDNKVVTAPTLQSRLTDGGVITGKFSNEEFEYLVRTIRGGAIEGQLGDYPISIKTTGPAIGEENLSSGVTAALTALIIVAVFMAIYYLFAGLVADFALAANMVIILGVMAMIGGTFTLPGIAGIVLTIGMAVDANVLIFERIREELQNKADMKTAVRLGFDKALSTILDANITTLITCLVLGYTATAEIKGFAVTLGIGILATLFTALFCSRVFIEGYMHLTKAKTLPMAPTLLPGLNKVLSPNINWLAKRKLFFPVSAVLIVAGLFAVYERGEDLLDIEFRSGTKVSFTFRDVEGGQKITLARSAVEERIDAYATIAADIQAGREPRVPEGIDPEAVTEMRRVVQEARERHESALAAYDKAIAEDLDPGDKPDALADFTLLTRKEISIVTEGKTDGNEASGFGVSTLVTDPRAVSDLIKAAFDAELDTTQPIDFKGDAAGSDLGAAPVYRITSTDLSKVVGRTVTLAEGQEPADYLGGVAILLEDMYPAPTVEDIKQRITRMRQQPAHEERGGRTNLIIGLDVASTDEAGEPHYRSALVLSTDGRTDYVRTPATFTDSDGLAFTEWKLVLDALQRDTSLASVTKFSAQVSGTMKQQAMAAMFLSLLAVVAYIWLRFGSIRYGLAAIAALVHDVCITLGIVAICGWLVDAGIGGGLLLSDFKIDLALVAAVLTIIGYSLNDTIVVFDRIRENRGRLARASNEVVNDSINQTISRTLLTSGTTLIAVVTLYILGGPGVHGFAFAMIIGVLVGTYSSVAIASPVLMVGYRGKQAPVPSRDAADDADKKEVAPA